ncbi:MAG: universal stress protein [Bryobacterales bacterium]
MSGFRRILVCWAGATSNAGLLPYARALAALNPAPELAYVNVMCESSPLAQQGSTPPAAAAKASASAADDQLQRLEELRQAIERDAYTGRGTRCCVRLGEPLDQILLYATELQADAILLGHDPRRRGRRSLARRLAAAAPCAVWMAPNGAAPGIRRVLAAFDCSDSAAEAVRVAALVAGSAGLEELHLLHVCREKSPSAANDPQPFLSKLDLGPLAARLIIEQDEVAGRAIVRTAAKLKADLVVVGARGQNPSAAVLLGSETEQALRESTVPVLVVKAQASAALSFNALWSDRAYV